MSSDYVECSKCQQWINLDINYYDVVETSDGKTHFLHHDFCAHQFTREHNVKVLEQHSAKGSTFLGD